MEDWLGLKQLDEEGKLHFYQWAGHHMLMTSMITKYTFVPLILGLPPAEDAYKKQFFNLPMPGPYKQYKPKPKNKK